jgi:hypothetical protein
MLLSIFSSITTCTDVALPREDVAFFFLCASLTTHFEVGSKIHFFETDELDEGNNFPSTWASPSLGFIIFFTTCDILSAGDTG